MNIITIIHNVIVSNIFTTSFFLIFLFFSCGSDKPNESTSSSNVLPGFDNRFKQKNSDDFPEMVERRFIRVLTTFNSTNYFITSKGKQKGLEYELMTNFAKYINKDIQDSTKKVHFIFHSVPFDNLIPLLEEGRGDIAAAGITVTQKRKELVAFSNPYISNVSEVVVMHKDSKPILNINDLSGRKVHVVSGSSFVESLSKLNESLEKTGKNKVEIIEVDSTLDAEDILVLVDAGVYEYTVTDSHVADLWQRMLDNIIVRKDTAISSSRSIAWAARKSNPMLVDKLNEFVETSEQGTLLGNMLLNRYYFERKNIDNPLSENNIKNLNKYISSFKKYGEMFNFDWLFIAAIAFQESQFDQNKRSSAGAVGIMQIKPSTAKDKNVGVKGVEESADSNIHASVKYLDFLRSRYYVDSEISIPNQFYFTVAAYNAGPARINRLRKRAEKTGRDKNQWFNHVEYEAMREVGRETVDYVANINKYYMAYKSIQKTIQDKRETTNSVSDI